MINIIKNPAHNNWYGSEWRIQKEFIQQVALYDTAVHSKHGHIEDGTITMVNINGIIVSTLQGSQFVKWHHIVEIVKEEHLVT